VAIFDSWNILVFLSSIGLKIVGNDMFISFCEFDRDEKSKTCRASSMVSEKLSCSLTAQTAASYFLSSSFLMIP